MKYILNKLIVLILILLFIAPHFSYSLPVYIYDGRDINGPYYSYQDLSIYDDKDAQNNIKTLTSKKFFYFESLLEKYLDIFISMFTKLVNIIPTLFYNIVILIYVLAISFRSIKILFDRGFAQIVSLLIFFILIATSVFLYSNRESVYNYLAKITYNDDSIPIELSKGIFSELSKEFNTPNQSMLDQSNVILKDPRGEPNYKRAKKIVDNYRYPSYTDYAFGVSSFHVNTRATKFKLSVTGGLFEKDKPIGVLQGLVLNLIILTTYLAVVFCKTLAIFMIAYSLVVICVGFPFLGFKRAWNMMFSQASSLVYYMVVYIMLTVVNTVVLFGIDESLTPILDTSTSLNTENISIVPAVIFWFLGVGLLFTTRIMSSAISGLIGKVGVEKLVTKPPIKDTVGIQANPSSPSPHTNNNTTANNNINDGGYLGTPGSTNSLSGHEPTNFPTASNINYNIPRKYDNEYNEYDNEPEPITISSDASSASHNKKVTPRYVAELAKYGVQKSIDKIQPIRDNIRKGAQIASRMSYHAKSIADTPLKIQSALLGGKKDERTGKRHHDTFFNPFQVENRRYESGPRSTKQNKAISKPTLNRTEIEPKPPLYPQPLRLPPPKPKLIGYSSEVDIIMTTADNKGNFRKSMNRKEQQKEIDYYKQFVFSDDHDKNENI